MARLPAKTGLPVELSRMMPMLAAEFGDSQGWNARDARSRRARAWGAALLTCALHAGVASLIWSRQAPRVPLAFSPAVPESLLVDLLAPRRQAAPDAPANRGDAKPATASEPQTLPDSPPVDPAPAQPMRARPAAATPSRPRGLTAPTPRDSAPPGRADTPSAAPRDFSLRSSDMDAPGERRARGESVPRIAPKATAEPSALSREMAKAARPPCRDAHAAKGLLALPFLLADTVTDSGCKW